MVTHHPAKGVELYREDGAFVVLVELSEFDREDVDLRWHDRRLHVEAERHEPGERSRVFHRSVGLPRPIREADITATIEDGVLEVTLPIDDRAREGRRIDIT
ncbi:Hsp20/alpha crystallin family protein [Halomicroarcula sp. F13]|uniref:Hsp20/alpha crystallin family protein n=1 Tax=Haloarcula rubra TaxID=2487747 RepID=A0AAW4PNV7_9EURY|nr:Hsp20/alpha crystallin family protein [Halomicroarcula rubra]MBX0322806.1 Hsp20/alpha crystallin family protein [Halomicroarcula rubra]